LVWSDGISNGGNSVIDYQVWFDQGKSEYVVLASGLSSRSYTAIGLYSASTYSFKVKARNSVGYSAFSNELSILAA